MEPMKACVSYICPDCGRPVFADVDPFSLSGGSYISCPCESGEKLHITVSPDRKYVISVPCIACPEPHTFRLSGPAFFGRDLFALQCPFSALDVCYIGKTEKVKKAAAENLEYIQKNYAEQSGDEFLSPGDKNLKELYEKYDEPMIMLAVLNILRDHAAYGDLRCKCGADGDIDAAISRDGVTLRCKKCGAKAFFRALTEADVDYLCEFDKIILK